MKKALLFGIVLILLSSFVCAMAPTLANVDEYFTFDDSDYSAPTLTGLVGNYDLTNSGLATTGATGIYLQSWDYDGTNDYSTSTANTDVSNRKLSVNMWAKCDATGADSVLFNLGPQDDGIALRYRIANLIELFEKIDGDFDTGTQAGTCDTSNFVMYTVTIDDTANEMKLYLNTVFQFTVTMDGLLSNIATPVLYIGNRPDGGGGNTNLWNGNIDEVSVYTDVLTTDEIDYLYNSGSPDAGQQYPFSATPTFDITAINFYNSSSILTFNANVTNSTQSQILNTTTGTIESNISNIVSVTIYNITGEEGIYFNRTYLNYNSSNNLIAELWQVVLNLTAEDSNGNIIKNFNCSNEYFSSNTTNGTINNLEVNANITFSCDSGSYSTREHTTDSFLVSTDLETVIFINTSMDLNFFHENNNTPYIEEEITLSLVNEDFNQSFNYSTTSSHITIHSIPNSFYTLAFGSNDTNKRFIHYYIPPDALTFKLDLYLLDMDLAKTVAYIVQDENAKVVSGAFINVSKFFIQNNSFMQTGYYETNVNGVVGIDKDDYSIYKEEIVYLNEIKATDIGPFIFAVSGTTKTFTIALEEDTTGELVDISKINFTISHSTTTGQFTFDWVDPLESINGVYINVLQNKILNPIINLSYSGSYGTETYNFNTTGSYTVVGFLNTSSGLVYTSGEALIIRSTPEQTNLQNMLFIIVIWVIASFILFLQIDWRLALTMSTMIVPYMFIKLGFLLMGMGSLFVNLIFIIIIIMITK